MTPLAPLEAHTFEAAGEPFAYLPSGAVFQLPRSAQLALDLLREGALDQQELLEGLIARGISAGEAEETVEEMRGARLIGGEDAAPAMEEQPVTPFPLQTLVLNLTNQCNLSCQYCYEFGEDRVATPEGKPKFMDWETAQASVDYLFVQAAGRRAVSITFFGGETLMNFRLLERVVEYAKVRAAEGGQYVDFSLTTNGTLLTPEIIEFLANENIGVTVSLDGPPELNDKLRVFANGRGSYGVIAPKVRALLARHTTRPIAARVTLTAEVTDVLGIFKHLKHDLGFTEVGFAPVTTSSNRLYSIGPQGLDRVLEQFRFLAEEYRDHALRNETHGFSNVSDTLTEIHQGVNKSHPCGAGLGLVGIGPSGDIAPCHRFVDSDAHALGHVSTGIDTARQADFLHRGHINRKYDCHTCFARPLCAGGCHHEAFVRYGDTGHPNLHYCDWIRDWTALCLRIYGEIAARNPAFLNHF
ncbi:MAG: quinohemoprotein amine dehydrogenase maturation protein [Acidobacteria bacterium]|nr:quinohemoprotein amine dehydrogenase maturation protein [Acidobacteriota bacterium]